MAALLSSKFGSLFKIAFVAGMEVIESSEGEDFHVISGKKKFVYIAATNNIATRAIKIMLKIRERKPTLLSPI